MEKEHLIKKWLNNNLTQVEEVSFKGLDDYVINQTILDSAKNFKAGNFSEPISFQDFKSNYLNRRNESRRLNWSSPIFKIASIIIIGISIYTAATLNRTTEITTLASEKTIIELPDASSVTLNSVSEISFNKKNWESSRRVNLKGEAFFKVTPGSTFNVVTSSGIVTVIGTEFNVKQREKLFSIKCYEGTVSVKSDSILKTLNAGDSFKIYKGIISEGNFSSNKPNWIDHSSTFHAISLKDVLAELERQYSIEITAQGVDLEKLFTGSFIHDNLDQALISITQPMNLKYKLNLSNRVVLYEIKN